MEVRVVPMAGEHLDQLARLEALCFSQPWSRQALEEELQNPAAHFLTALDEGGQVLGYLGLTAVLDESYIANVAVFPHCRGRGVAKALLRAQLDWARERGIATMSLEVTLQPAGHRPLPAVRLPGGGAAAEVLSAPHRGRPDYDRLAGKRHKGATP